MSSTVMTASSKRRRTDVSWRTWLYRGLITLAATIVVLALVYLYVRMQVLERLNAETTTLWSRHNEEGKRFNARLDATVSRLDYLESVLFGEVLAKVQKMQQPVPVPRWQLSRDLELRDRILRLEWARRTLETKVEALEDAK